MPTCVQIILNEKGPAEEFTTLVKEQRSATAKSHHFRLRTQLKNLDKGCGIWYYPIAPPAQGPFAINTVKRFAAKNTPMEIYGIKL